MLSALSEGFFLQLSFRGKWVHKMCSRVGLKPMLPFFTLLLILSVSVSRHCSDCGSSSPVYFYILLGVRCHHFACSTAQKEHEYPVCTLKSAPSGSCCPQRLSLRRHVCAALLEKMVRCVNVHVATNSSNYSDSVTALFAIFFKWTWLLA